MDDRRPLGAGPGVDVDRRANDLAGDRDAAEQAADDVAEALGHEFAVGWSRSPLGVEPVDCLGRQEGLERADQGDRQPGGVDGGVANLAEVGGLHEAGHAGERFGDRHLHAMNLLDRPDAADLGKEPVSQKPEHDDRQRSGDAAGLGRPPVAPEPDQAQGCQADHHRPGVDVVEDLEELGEGRLLVGLKERHLPFVVLVVAEEVGDLLEDQDHADRREQAANDARRHERLDEPPLGQAEGDLDQARHHHRQEEGLEGAEGLDFGGHHGCQPGGRAGDHHLGPAQPADHHARHDPRNQARDRIGPGGQRDPQAEGQGHEKRNHASHQVAGDVARLEG